MKSSPAQANPRFVSYIETRRFKRIAYRRKRSAKSARRSPGRRGRYQPAAWICAGSPGQNERAAVPPSAGSRRGFRGKLRFVGEAPGAKAGRENSITTKSFEVPPRQLGDPLTTSHLFI